MRPRKHKNADWDAIKGMYLGGMTSNDISKIVGISPTYICRTLKSLGVNLRSVSKSLAIKYPNGRVGGLSGHWKGGRVQGGNKKQYIMIHSPDHPSANKDGYVMEHRLVVEKGLGRLLNSEEFVHHKNGNQQDNRPENLEVLTKQQHSRRHFDDCKRIAELEEEIAGFRRGQIEEELAALSCC